MQLWVTAFLVIMLVSLPAGAGGSPSRGEIDTGTEKARELHAQGDRLYQRGEYARAHASYVAAWSLKKHYQIAGNLGDCEVRLGNYRDGAEHLSYFIRGYPKDKPVDRLIAGIKLFRQAESKVGTISITVDATGADIFVEGKMMGQSPLSEPIYLDPGSRLVEARRGQQVAWARIDVTPGISQTVALRLAPDSDARSKEPRYLRPVIATVFSAAGFSTGIVLAVEANAARIEFEQGKLNAHVAKPAILGIWSGAFLAAGLGAALYARHAWPRNISGIGRVAVAPMATPRGAGFLVTGQF